MNNSFLQLWWWSTFRLFLDPNSSRTSAHLLSRDLSTFKTESDQSLNQAQLQDRESELLVIPLQAGSERLAKQQTWDETMKTNLLKITKDWKIFCWKTTLQRGVHGALYPSDSAAQLLRRSLAEWMDAFCCFLFLLYCAARQTVIKQASINRYPSAAMFSIIVFGWQIND